MQKKSYDCLFCIQSSMQTLKAQREKLWAHSSSAHHSLIYNGLHESESDSLRSWYFQAYLTEWLDMHWNQMEELIESHQEYRTSARKQMMLFFAGYFSELIAGCSDMGELADLAIPELLKIKRQTIREMIEMADCYLEKNGQLKADARKHRERYRRLIENNKKEVDSDE